MVGTWIKQTLKKIDTSGEPEKIIWSVTQDSLPRACDKLIEDTRQRILDEWEKMDQGSMNTSIRPWRVRLRECVTTIIGQFEHKLWINYSCKFILC